MRDLGISVTYKMEPLESFLHEWEFDLYFWKKAWTSM